MTFPRPVHLKGPRTDWHSPALQHLGLATVTVPTSAIGVLSTLRFQQLHMEKLTDSIAEHGVLTPLIVRPERDGQYELINGLRRLTVAEKLGITSVPVSICLSEDTNDIIYLRLHGREQFFPNEVDDYLAYLLERCGFTMPVLSEHLQRLTHQSWPAEHDAELTLLHGQMPFFEFEAIQVLTAYCVSSAAIIDAYKSKLLSDYDLIALTFGQQLRSAMLMKILERQREFAGDIGQIDDNVERSAVRSMIEVIIAGFEWMLEEQSITESPGFERRILDAIAYAAQLHGWFEDASLMMFDQSTQFANPATDRSDSN